MAYLPHDETEFKDAIAEAVRAYVPGAVAEGVRLALRKPLLQSDEVCKMTGWSRRKLAYLKAARKLPFVQRGRTVLYPADAVEAYLREGLVPARGEG